MGFSGGGSNVLKPHKHDGTVVQDGGSLDFDNITQADLTAGDVIFSNGTHLQRLAVGSAADTLVVNGAATAPEWSAGGATLTTNTITSRLASSFSTSSSTWTSVTSLSIDLSNQAGGIAIVDLNCCFSGTGTTQNHWHSLYDDGVIAVMSIGEMQGYGGNHIEGSSGLSTSTGGQTIAAYAKTEASVNWTGTASDESCNLIGSEVY